MTASPIAIRSAANSRARNSVSALVRAARSRSSPSEIRSLSEQDQRGCVCGLGGEHQVEQNERVRVKPPGEGHDVYPDPDSHDDGLDRERADRGWSRRRPEYSSGIRYHRRYQRRRYAPLGFGPLADRTNDIDRDDRSSAVRSDGDTSQDPPIRRCTISSTRSGSSGLNAGLTKPPTSSTTSTCLRGRVRSRGSQ